MQELLFRGGCADAIGVLHADDRRDGLGLGQVRGRGVGDAQVPDQHAEMLGDRARRPPLRQPQVDHVEMVPAELAQVLLDLAAQLPWRGPQPLTRRIAAWPDLARDDQIVRVRRQRLV